MVSEGTSQTTTLLWVAGSASKITFKLEAAMKVFPPPVGTLKQTNAKRQLKLSRPFALFRESLCSSLFCALETFAGFLVLLGKPTVNLFSRYLQFRFETVLLLLDAGVVTELNVLERHGLRFAINR